MWKYGGKKFYSEEDFLTAYYSDEVKKRPHSALFLPLADIHFRNKRYTLALETVLAGLRVMPHYISAHYLLGQIYYALERLDDALEALEYVVRKKPDNLAALSLLAQVCLNKGEIRRAAKLYQKLVHLNPRDKDALEILQHLPDTEEKSDEGTDMALIKSGLVVLDDNMKELARIAEMVIAGEKPSFEETQPSLSEDALHEIREMREREEESHKMRKSEQAENTSSVSTTVSEQPEGETKVPDAYVLKALEGMLERLDARQQP